MCISSMFLWHQTAVDANCQYKKKSICGFKTRSTLPNSTEQLPRHHKELVFVSINTSATQPQTAALTARLPPHHILWGLRLSWYPPASRFAPSQRLSPPCHLNRLWTPISRPLVQQLELVQQARPYHTDWSSGWAPSPIKRSWSLCFCPAVHC